MQSNYVMQGEVWLRPTSLQCMLLHLEASMSSTAAQLPTATPHRPKGEYLIAAASISSASASLSSLSPLDNDTKGNLYNERDSYAYNEVPWERYRERYTERDTDRQGQPEKQRCEKRGELCPIGLQISACIITTVNRCLWSFPQLTKVSK